MITSVQLGGLIVRQSRTNLLRYQYDCKRAQVADVQCSQCSMHGCALVSDLANTCVRKNTQCASIGMNDNVDLFVAAAVQDVESTSQ